MVNKKTVLGLVAALLLLWGFRQAVPAGLGPGSFEPFYLWSRDLGTFPSPEGTQEVRVVINDAGAMHSGNHWTWVLSYSRLWGRRVVAEGYLDYADTQREKLPLRWLCEGEVEVRFRQGRRSVIEAARTYPVQ